MEFDDDEEEEEEQEDLSAEGSGMDGITDDDANAVNQMLENIIPGSLPPNESGTNRNAPDPSSMPVAAPGSTAITTSENSGTQDGINSLGDGDNSVSKKKKKKKKKESKSDI